jgi:acyl carrier protein
LVGYVVGRAGRELTVGQLQAWVRARLPDYMVPGVFVFVEALPLTPTGKVDRRALSALEHERPSVASRYVAPRTPVEAQVAAIWAEVLGVAQVGVEDNFFELGGHSLLATQVIYKVQEAFHVELPLERLFDSPTIIGLSIAIGQSLVTQEDAETVAAVLEELNQMSEEDAKKMLTQEVSR